MRRWLASARAAAVADLKLHSSGKVREIYEWEDDLLMVASDRISIYDVVMPTPIPDKGKVLNRMSEFWFELTGDIVPNHFISDDVPEEVDGTGDAGAAAGDVPGRVRRPRLPLGLGLEGIQGGRAVCGIELPANLLESDKLPEPIFTPATKAEIGDHDENVDFERAAEIVGDRALMEELRRISIEVYQRGADHAAERGIILADTKFEFGRHAGAEIVLGDEVLTPDSSRFWPADRYEPGTHAALLRQAVRPRLGRRGRLGPQAAGAGAATRRGRADPRQVRRGLRADHGAQLLVAEGTGPDPAQGGDPRPAGQGGRAGAAGARLRGRSSTSGSAAWSSSRPRTPSGSRELCEKLLANPLIEDFEIEPRRRRVIWGVLQFPGSCDERDALQPASGRRGAAGLARGARPRRGSTRSSSPVASPTATTCGLAQSPASRRRWRR